MARSTGKRKEPAVVYTRTVLEPPGSQEELREILLWWELALARRAYEQLKS